MEIINRERLLKYRELELMSLTVTSQEAANAAHDLLNNVFQMTFPWVEAVKEEEKEADREKLRQLVKEVEKEES